MNNYTYYYLHTNGQLLQKAPVVVENDPSYFDSPFVAAVWRVEFDKLDSLEKIVREAELKHCINLKSELKFWLDMEFIKKDIYNKLLLEIDRTN